MSVDTCVALWVSARACAGVRAPRCTSSLIFWKPSTASTEGAIVMIFSAGRARIFVTDITEHADSECRGACADRKVPEKRLSSRPFRHYPRVRRGPSVFAVGMRNICGKKDTRSGPSISRSASKSAVLICASLCGSPPRVATIGPSAWMPSRTALFGDTLPQTALSFVATRGTVTSTFIAKHSPQAQASSPHAPWNGFMS